MKNIFKHAFNATKCCYEFAMESHGGTSQKREDEIVVYAQIKDFEGLKKANSKESQEQWQVSAPFGKIRVRKSWQENLAATYEQTIKTRNNQVGVAGGTEQNFPIDESTFNCFKEIADNGMIKDRYVFKASNISALDSSGKEKIDTSSLCYEVDVYPDGNGGYHPWCKIDIEINSLLDSISDVKGEDRKIKLTFDVTSLPFKPVDIIMGSTTDPEEKAKITQLFDKYFLAKKDEAGNIIQVSGTQAEQTTESAETPAEQKDQKPVEQPTQEETKKGINKSLTEESQKYIADNLDLFKDKSFEGKRTGIEIKFNDEAGTEHTLKSTWGVKGTNVVVDLSFDQYGDMTETVRKNDEGKVVKAE